MFKLNFPDLIPELTTSEVIQVVVACVPAVAATAAVAAVLVNPRNERRRTQPIVIAHERSPRRFAPGASGAAWAVEAYLTNDGAGPAFNVRFGVEFDGVRYPHRLRIEDPPERQRPTGPAIWTAPPGGGFRVADPDRLPLDGGAGCRVRGVYEDRRVPPLLGSVRERTR